ncbi:MAG: acyl-CoA dehydrogenase [Candidatus Niyogibacteria bacterium CG10_big_fil_rev_8_21_14_0_10_46_36]|uniref:Acyl-CoA dehydrogenase n=1 Tax=Candidatus Niyogibacteria bacterium CG10_big_fil_rev_8_21_14_0_10_46_36 TaxID=1974726 RepID=A0A2H0TDV6_9BACT|nr:MAG: acyl-CoA dehydrogenase [Candidatus Niyogibacteria bacterium CG10_big_fil_rev_8_21_14_0_10_46_36]
MEWYDHVMFDSEAKNISDTVDAFLRDEAMPVIAGFEERAEFPHALVSIMAKIGLFGVTIPEAYGGSGFNSKIASLIARKIAYVSGGLHLIWTANSSLAAFPIMYAGNEIQKKNILPLLASGEKLGCFGLTEAEAGSDAASLRMRATKQKRGWVLNGSKIFITNAYNASVGVLFARTGSGRHDISAFIIESHTPGFADIVGVTVNKIEKHILACSDFCEIVCDNVVLPESALLGEENKGFKIAMATLDGGRINIGAQALGIAGRIFDEALVYTKDRRQFGKSIWDNQSVQFHFAEWHASLLSAWFTVLSASTIRDEGNIAITPIASAAKLQATESAYAVATRAARYLGGMAVTKDIRIFLRVFETFSTTIYEGSSEMQKKVIARELKHQ